MPFFTGKTIIRAMLMGKNGSVWLSGSGGMVARYEPADVVRERRILFDTITPDFRSMSETTDAVFVLSAGSPALLYKMDKVSLKAHLVYRDASPDVFYDALRFSDEKNGIAVGDPLGGCFSILITNDGGNTWTKSQCSAAPEAQLGEACFAASNSGLVVNGLNVWFASGGKKARLFHSPDFGKHWNVLDTPMAQGSQMTGIFTMDAVEDEIVVAGGNYQKLKNAERNMAVSEDGGQTWQPVTTPFGYVSCIRYGADKIKGHWIAATVSGVFETYDTGKTWRKLVPDFFNVVLPGADGWIYAGGNNVASRFFGK